jgi:hypothetical protein
MLLKIKSSGADKKKARTQKGNYIPMINDLLNIFLLLNFSRFHIYDKVLENTVRNCGY